ncbi:MAG: hypothetical protein JSV60_01875, partial [Desulfobacterales bacterium]
VHRRMGLRKKRSDGMHWGRRFFASNAALIELVDDFLLRQSWIRDGSMPVALSPNSVFTGNYPDPFSLRQKVF